MPRNCDWEANEFESGPPSRESLLRSALKATGNLRSQIFVYRNGLRSDEREQLQSGDTFQPIAKAEKELTNADDMRL
jgi:hypothetical protein